MRAAVYDGHLETMGGGERYACMLAAVLAGMDQVTAVDLVGHGELTLSELENHLGLALPGVSLRLIPDRGEDWVSDLSGEYDLFVNASYMSRVVSRARFSAYAVYFPTPWDHDLTRLQRGITRVLSPLTRGANTLHTYGLGWFPPEGGRRRSWSWTSGDAELGLPAGEATTVHLTVGRPGTEQPAVLEVILDGAVAARTKTSPGQFVDLHVDVPASDRPRLIRLHSDTFSPPPPDRRQLGVAVSSVRLGAGRFDARQWLVERLPYLLRDSGNVAFLDSYDQVLSISEFTSRWVQRLWERQSEILYPPVHTTAVAPGPKQQQILSIGRFFAADRGHSKKQLELVQTFVAAQDSGLLQGWEFHLVGGCSPEDEAYLDQVRRAGAGHAVHVHANAPRSVVQDLLGSASVFWHATGLGEHLENKPWVFEHFGITTVEAMAAGCVPVVIAHAGQFEIVRDGVDGYLFTSLDELRDHTVQLADDAKTRGSMAASAAGRADLFSEHAFADRWRELADKLLTTQ